MHISQIHALVLIGSASVYCQEWDHSLYSSSPPVFPSRKSHLELYLFILAKNLYLAKITGAGGWEEALALADIFTAQLTLEEKTRVVTGTTGPCVVSYTC